MHYKNLDLGTWDTLDSSGNIISGYKSIWLSLSETQESDLHIFKDELGKFHLAIKANDVTPMEVKDPNINGLRLELKSYKFENDQVDNFINIICTVSSYLKEFTEVVKEISHKILHNGEKPLVAVSEVIDSWIIFWGNQRREILSEEEQIGLLSELLLLEKLCYINPKTAMDSWKGPLGDPHDFHFIGYNIEVKGTRSTNREHLINGLSQLKKPSSKKLLFLSFILSNANSDQSFSLPKIIHNIKIKPLKKHPHLVVQFNELLSKTGYSPIHEAQYREFKLEVLNGSLYVVDEEFPKLTDQILTPRTNERILSVTYKISLIGLNGDNFEEINWGEYFF